MFWNRKKGKTREPQAKLSRTERKQLEQIRAQNQRSKYPQTAQQTIPYLRMYPDGLCRVTETRYSKTIQFHDINYRQAQPEDQRAMYKLNNHPLLCPQQGIFMFGALAGPIRGS